MAFLDNSGDIILDAVLTDVGRTRMSQGDGTFRINHFKLGDDEINYGLYNSSHLSGNAYYDLEIRQTPILESFSFGGASLKSQLISYTDPNLLYLPELIWNTNENKNYGDKVRKFPYDPASTAVVLAATPGTAYAFGPTSGVLNGGSRYGKNDNHIRLEYGLNAEGKTPEPLRGVDPELDETQFVIECDTRFCIPTDINNRPVPQTFLDENFIGTYTITTSANNNIIKQSTQFGTHTDPDQPEMKWARGPRLEFKLQPSLLLRDGRPSESKSLWGKHGLVYGSTDWTTAAAAIGTRETCGTENAAAYQNNLQLRAEAGDFYHIDTNIRVTALRTGARIDIPVVIVKSINFVTDCT